MNDIKFVRGYLKKNDDIMEKRWSIFEAIRDNIGIPEEMVPSEDVLALYEIFGSACPSVQTLQANPDCLAKSYIFLMKVVQ